uniref:RNase_PH domain-containing protein n=1 Tax=Haemonchus placei TaxID=6290 RepID=A0A0N4WU28_HAEPC
MAIRIGRLFIGTITSRSISTAARQVELDNAMEKIKCDILGLTEARIPYSGSYELPSGTILFHSGAKTAHRGVAFVTTASP